MKAIILAAGEGTRLHPHTLDRPKCLVEIDGVSLLDRQLAVLNSRGIHDVVLIVGYQASMLHNKASRLYQNDRYAETNMVWTLFCAQEEFEEDAVVAYGDIVYSGGVLDRLLASSGDIAVAVDKDWEKLWCARSDDPLSDAESLKLGDEGQIVEIGQRPSGIEEIEGQYMGLMKITAAGFGTLAAVAQGKESTTLICGKSIESAYMTDLLQAVIDKGLRVESVAIHGDWVEVDTGTDLALPITRDRLSTIHAEIQRDRGDSITG